MDFKKRPQKQEKSTFVQIVLGLIANLSNLAPSMSLGFSAVVLPYLLDTSKPHHLTDNEASWFASIASIAAPLGCFLSGPLSDRFGRKPAIFCVNIICFLGWGIIALAYYYPTHQYVTLLIGRFLSGFSAGLSSMPACVYMAEIATAHLRGMLTAWSGLFFSLGVVVVYVLGWIMTYNWGMIAIISAAFPCACMIMVITYMVESPSWLIGQNRVEEATKSMGKLYGTKEYIFEMYEEIEALVSRRNKTKVQRHLNWRSFLEPTFYKPFALMSTFFLFQQLSGTFVIIFYAIDIVKEVNIKVDAYFSIVLVATMRTIGSVFVSAVSKKIGRRFLSLVSGVGMTIFLLLLSGYVVCVRKGVLPVDQMNWIPLTCLVGYFFLATLGFLTMPFIMSAEVFPTNIRGLATGLVTSIGYIGGFLMVKIYPDMLHAMGTFPLFLFYAAMAAMGTVFVLFALPETKGKTLAEIEDEFSTNKNKKPITIELENISLTI